MIDCIVVSPNFTHNHFTLALLNRMLNWMILDMDSAMYLLRKIIANKCERHTVHLKIAIRLAKMAIGVSFMCSEL